MQTPDTSQLNSLIIAVLITLGIIFLFCRSLSRVLAHIDDTNKAIKPWLVWLLLVPGLNYIINFIVVFGVSKSIANELESRDFEIEDKPAFLPGMLYAVLTLAVFAIIMMQMIGVELPASLAPAFAVIGFSQIFFFVQYWMKINWYKDVLENDKTTPSSKE